MIGFFTFFVAAAATTWGPPASFSTDQNMRRLIERTSKPALGAKPNIKVKETTGTGPSNVPTRDRSDAELINMLAESTWVYRSPTLDPAFELSSPWHHPAITVLIDRGKSNDQVRQQLLEPLHNLLRGGGGDSPFHASLVLAALGDPRGLPELSNKLVEPKASIELKTAAAIELAHFPERIASKSFARLLDPWFGKKSDRLSISEDDEPIVSALFFAYVHARLTEPDFDPISDPMIERASKATVRNLRRCAAMAYGGRSWDPIPPALQNALDDSDPSVRRTALVALTVHPTSVGRAVVLRFCSDTDQQVAIEAVRRLCLYPDIETTNRLVDLAQSSSTALRQAAIEAAGNLQQEAIVIRAASDTQSSVRATAAIALGKIRSDQAIAELARLTKDDRSPSVQAAALASLSQQPPKQSIPIILDALGSAAVSTRAEAARYLTALLPSAATFAATESAEVRERQVQEIREEWERIKPGIGQQATSTVTANFRKYSNEDLALWVTRWFETEGKERELIGNRLQSLSPTQLPVIENALLHSDIAPTPEFMERVLAAMDPAYKTIAKLSGASPASVEQSVSTLMTEFEHRSMTPLQALVVTINGTESNERAIWLRLMPIVLRDYGDPIRLEEVGPPAKDLLANAVDAIEEKGLSHPDDLVREETCLRLAERKHSRHTDRLAELMADPNERVRRAAIQAAGATADKDVLASLKDAIKSPSPQIQVEAAAQLLKQGDRDGFESMRRLLSSSDDAIRRRVIDELALHPELDREASLQLLTQALADGKLEVRQHAVAALEKVVGHSHGGTNGRLVPINEQVTRWKRTMASYFAKPESEEKMRQMNQLRETQQHLNVLPLAN